MENIDERRAAICEAVLKNVAAKCIYLFGSYAYGEPNEQSDIDIYAVIPDNCASVSEIYGKIMVDLSMQKLFVVDLLLSRESVFNARKNKNILERTICQKGTILYEH